MNLIKVVLSVTHPDGYTCSRDTTYDPSEKGLEDHLKAEGAQMIRDMESMEAGLKVRGALQRAGQKDC